MSEDREADGCVLCPAHKATYLSRVEAAGRLGKLYDTERAAHAETQEQLVALRRLAQAVVDAYITFGVPRHDPMDALRAHLAAAGQEAT